MRKSIVIGKETYYIVKATQQDKTALGRARERYLMQTSAFRVPRATQDKLKFLKWATGKSMTSFIVEAVDDFFTREVAKMGLDPEVNQAPESGT